MVPEISHRCSACGASVRDFGERAMFCPECGQSLMGSEPALPTESEAASEVAPQSNLSVQPEPSPATTLHADVSLSETPSAGDEAPPEAREKMRHGARERTRETLHRASNVARGAIEDNVKRVEKIHHVSTAMFEEATYDPSLRFVLVALGLFVVFVILLVLSKVMG
ncbi:MAG: hypothetical protein ACXW3C_01760 [Pyrinomonadaceae bacterium]